MSLEDMEYSEHLSVSHRYSLVGVRMVLGLNPKSTMRTEGGGGREIGEEGGCQHSEEMLKR